MLKSWAPSRFQRRALRCAVLGLLLLFPLAARAENSYGLLIGCTEYPNLKKKYSAKVYENVIRLIGPANDCDLMRDTLVGVLGYPAANVTTLSGWSDDAATRPTRKNILGALDRLATKAKSGDRVFILLAGHGTQTKDRAGDELDGLDEVFLPADVAQYHAKQGRLPGAISDDEIGRRVAAIRKAGAFVWIVMDCCHSGTMVRGADPELRVRYLSPGMLGIPTTASSTPAVSNPRTDGQDLGDAPTDGYVAMYAAQSYRKAPEMRLPRGDFHGKSHGLFSYMLARAVTRSGGQLTYRDLQAQILAGYQTLPYENAVPLAEGDLDRRIVGTQTTEGAQSLRIHVDGKGQAILSAGKLWGVVPGAMVAIHPLGRHDVEPIGYARVKDVDMVRAVCELVRKEGEQLPELPELEPHTAVFSERPIEGVALPVATVDDALRPVARERVPEEVRDYLKRSAELFPWVEDPTEAEWLIVVADEIYLQPVRAGAPQRFHVPSGDLEFHLRRLFKVRNLKRLTVDHLTPPGDGLEVNLWRIDARGQKLPLAAGGRLRPGDEIEVEAKNESGKIYDLTILLLDAHHGVGVLFPPRGTTARLTPHDRKSWKSRGRTNDMTLGLEHLLVLAIPRDEQQEVIDFTWLRQDALAMKLRGDDKPRHDGSPFAAVLDSLAFGGKTRGLQLESTSKESYQAFGQLISWRTEWPPIRSRSFPNAVASLPRLRGDVPEEGSRVPQAWSGLGDRAARGTSGVGKRDLLLVGGDVPTHIFVDVDESDATRGGEPDELTKMVSEKSFDAELLLRFDGEQRTVFYDTDNDGNFDLILEDDDGDMASETRYSLQNDTWTTAKTHGIPLLSTTYLGRWAQKHKVVAKLNRLLKEDLR